MVEAIEKDVTDQDMLMDLILMIQKVFGQVGSPCSPGISVECGMDNALVTASHPCLSVPHCSPSHCPCTPVKNTGIFTAWQINRVFHLLTDG